jgi:hypothetical protein
MAAEEMTEKRAQQIATILSDPERKIDDDVRNSMMRDLRAFHASQAVRAQQQKPNAALGTAQKEGPFVHKPTEPQFQKDRTVGRGISDRSPAGTSAAGTETGSFPFEVIGSIEKGVQDVGFNIVELGLLGASSAAEIADMPKLQAKINQIDLAFDKVRANVLATELGWLQNINPEAGFNPWLEIIGETLPLVRLLPNPSTYIRTLASNTGGGALFAGIAAAENADNLIDVWGEMKHGAMIGLGMSSLLIGTGITSFAGRKMTTEFEKQLSQDILKLERDLMKLNPDFKGFTVAEIGQTNPYLVGLGRGSAGELSLTAQNQKIDQTLQIINRRAAQFDTPEALVNDLGASLVKINKDMQKLASDRYGNNIQTLVNLYGDDLALPRQKALSYLDATRDIRGQLGDPRAFGSQIRQLDDHIQFLDSRINPYRIRGFRGQDGEWEAWEVVRQRDGRVMNRYGDGAKAEAERDILNNAQGGLNVEDVRVILEGHRQLMSGEVLLGEATVGGSSNNVAKFLNSKLLASMRGTSGDAVKGIQAAREAYKFDLGKLRAINESTLGRTFGPKAMEAARAEPDNALKILLGPQRSRASMQQTRKILQEADPILLDRLKRQTVRDIMTEGRTTGSPIAFNETTVARLEGALSGRGKLTNVGRRGLGLFSPIEQQEMIKVAKAMRVLAADAKLGFEKDTTGIFADATINLISQTAAFAGRFAVRIMSKGSSLERLMVDPQARKAMLALADKGPNRMPVKGAITFLSLWAGQSEAEDMKAARERIEQENRISPEERR